MRWHEISNKYGVPLGWYRAESEEAALAQMHQDAGYDVRLHEGELVFPDAETERLCGGRGKWRVHVAPYGEYDTADMTYTATQWPWVFDANHYRALALDEEGNEVALTWPIINPYTECEEDACNWDDFTVSPC